MADSLLPSDREWFAQLLKDEVDKIHDEFISIHETLENHNARLGSVESIKDLVAQTHTLVVRLDDRQAAIDKHNAVQDHEIEAIKAGKKAGLQTGTAVSVVAGVIILVVNHFLGLPNPAPPHKEQPQIQSAP